MAILEIECAIQISAVIINKCIKNNISLNTSKLMKLLYIMQIEHVLKYNTLMFTDQIKDSEYGPVIPSVEEYYNFGGLGFDKKVEQDIFLIDSHEEIVDSVLKKYSGFLPHELNNIIVNAPFYIWFIIDGVKKLHLGK